MRLDSVRSLKAEISAEVRAQAGGTPEARSFFEATEPPMPEGVALGLTWGAGADFGLAIRHTPEGRATAEHIAARLPAGEVHVREITVAKRTTPGYFQARLRPLEAGAQVQMRDKGFVGTLGGFVRDGAGILYALSNSHVIADEGTASPGHVVGQPFGQSPIGVLARFVPFSQSSPNLVDAALMRVDATPTLPRWNGALAGDVLGVRALGSSDIGLEVLKCGRTTGARRGKVTAVEVDGLPVAYDRGTLRFNDQFEVTGGPATDFSGPGDSGSLIVDADGYAVGLLFAGGKDQHGEDFTYANRLSVVLSALGVELAL